MEHDGKEQPGHSAKCVFCVVEQHGGAQMMNNFSTALTLIF